MAGESTVLEHFGAQLIFPASAAVGVPLKAGIADFARPGKVSELRQDPRQHRFVARAIMGRPESSPHRMIHKNRARRRNLAHDVECRARDESRNAPIFEHMGDETDGLMAERSVGHEQRQIDCLVCELIG